MQLGGPAPTIQEAALSGPAWCIGLAGGGNDGKAWEPCFGMKCLLDVIKEGAARCFIGYGGHHRQ